MCYSPWGCEALDTTERLHFHFSLSYIGEGNGNPLQCSCLENPKDGGAWWAAVSGVAQSPSRLKRLSSSSSSSLSFLQGNLPNPGIEPRSPALQVDSLPAEPQGKPKNTGVGCHFLLQCIKVKSEREVAQVCPTPSDPMDCSPPGSSVHGIFQARVLE